MKDSLGRILYTNLPALEITFNDIANVPVDDASSISEWNTFFDLPTYGTAFSSVLVNLNTVTLYGGSNITIKDGLFYGSGAILDVQDDIGCIVAAGAACFSGCYNLADPKLTALLSAGLDCFRGCTSLVNPDFSSLKTAGDYCFAFCTSLVNPNFSGLTSSGDSCFYSCTNMQNPDFSSLVTATYQCFMYCTSLALTIFTSLKTAEYLSFYGCSSLVNPDFSSLESIGEECYHNCSGLSNPNFSSVKTIGDYAFAHCSAFVDLNFPALENLGTTVANNNVFWPKYGLDITLTIPTSLMTCNGGNPDGDIQYLIDNNTVTIYNPSGVQIYPT